MPNHVDGHKYAGLGGIYVTLFIERMTENGFTFITVPTWTGKVSLSVSSAVFLTKKRTFSGFFFRTLLDGGHQEGVRKTSSNWVNTSQSEALFVSFLDRPVCEEFSKLLREYFDDNKENVAPWIQSNGIKIGVSQQRTHVLHVPFLVIFSPR